MREQVVTPRGSARSGSTARSRAGGITQRPLKRDRVVGGKGSNDHLARLRRVLGWLPMAVKITLIICMVVFVFAGYRAAASASFFQIKAIDVSGTSKTSADEIKSIVRRVGGASGVWQADLDQISGEIGKLTWVKTALVSRVLPDGIRVRILERTPRGVVHLTSGRFVWVDEDGVELGDIKSTDALPPFFLRGWDEERSEEAREANKDRIGQYIAMVESFGAAGVSGRVSEIDLNDMLDVRAHLAGDDSSVEIRLGGEDFAVRMQKGLKVLDSRRGAPRFQDITYIDLSPGSRGIVGLSQGQPVRAGDIAAPSDEAAIDGQGALADDSTSHALSTAARNSDTAKRNQGRDAGKQPVAGKTADHEKKGSKGTEKAQAAARR